MGLLAIKIGPKSSEDDDSEEEGSDPKLDAAKALIKAIKVGDADAVSMALEEHYALCASDHEADE